MLNNLMHIKKLIIKLKGVPDSTCRSCLFYIDGECLDIGNKCPYLN